MASALQTSLRTHTTASLQDEDVGTQAKLCGFFSRKINDVDPDFNFTDAHGTIRVSIDPTRPDALAIARKLSNEDVIQVTGEVKGLTADKPHLVEIRARHIRLFSKANALPFDLRAPEFESSVPFKKRLEHRHLDLRRPEMMQRLARRSKATFELRQALVGKGFVEIDTPVLSPWNAELIGTFAVPSSKYECYSLAGTPQPYKQMLMAGGVDRYFQMAKCFRDEGTYGPFHQPEFTVLDLEMAFSLEEDVYEVVNEAIGAVHQGVLGQKPENIQRLTYKEALDNYGTERPDLRFDLRIHDISDLALKSPSVILTGAVDASMGGKGAVKAICVPSDIALALESNALNSFEQALEKVPDSQGTYLQVADGGELTGSMSVAFDQDLNDELLTRLNAKAGDTIVLVISAHKLVAPRAAGVIRTHLAKRSGLTKSGKQAYVWIHDFPYFTYHMQGNLYFPNRHPMTQPHSSDLDKLQSLLNQRKKAAEEAGEPDPEQGIPFDKYIHPYGDEDAEQLAQIRSMGYELILNGEELATGSIRNHDLEQQNSIFELLDYDLEDSKRQFSHLYKALENGMPPHGGLAIGVDRLFATLEGCKTVMDVIAFPKDGLGKDLLMGSPGQIAPANLQAMLGQEPEEPHSEESELDNIEPSPPRTAILAAFNFSPGTAEVGKVVRLVDRSESIDPITSWIWDCPQLSWRSPLPNPKLLVRKAGNYEVSLTVESQSGLTSKAIGTVEITMPEEE